MEIRKCIKCGKEFEVDSRKGFSTSKRHILCNDCFASMSKEDRLALYTKRYVESIGEERTCLCCGKKFFVKSKSKDQRKTSKERLFCDECVKTYTTNQRRQIRMDKDPEYAEKIRAAKRESHKRNIITAILARARQRAAKYGYDFNLEASDIVIPETCPLLGIPIFCGDKSNYENSPSLDRIDNSKGYIKGNVWIISKKANSMKNSASFEELTTFCKNIKRYSLDNRESESIEHEDKELHG